MLRASSDIADELMDERPALPRDRAELKSFILRGMALEREACARDIEEMSPEVATSQKQHSNRADIFFVRQDRAASVIRARKAKAI